MEFLILPSPLLPEVAYEPLVDALRRRGVAARLLPAGPATTPPEVIERWASQFVGKCALVAHSNAGFLAPSVRSHAGSTAPVVFMDASLPQGTGAGPLAPASMLDRLRSLADPVSGLLPPWTRWWSRADLADAVPPEWYDVIDRACPQVPLGWFQSRIAAPRGWLEQPNAYLGFGSTYEVEQQFAAVVGWPLATLDGGHLHFLRDPDQVAGSVLDLVGACGEAA